MTHTHLNIEQLATQKEALQRQIDIIRKVTLELNSISNLQTKLDKILFILHEQFRIDHSMIVLPDGHGRLMVKASFGYGDTKHDRSVDVSPGIIGLSATHKKPINITGIRRKRFYFGAIATDVTETQRRFPGLEDPESQIAIPLISNDELVAVLMAESESPSVFSKDDESFLITLSQSIAVSIQNATLFDNMEELIAQRTAALEKSNRTRDQLFSIISHDLRGPVTSFHNISKLIHHYTRQGEKEKMDTLFDRVDKSVGRLNHLLDNLLHWSMAHRNEIRCHIQELDLLKLLNEVVALYEERFASKELLLHFNAPAKVLINGDYNTLSAVFRNILSNALKYTPRKGSITLSVNSNTEFVEVRCEDTGVGIAPDRLPLLFESIEYSSTTGTENERGTGLGLIVAKQFVALNNGELTIRSVAGSGTTVSVKLPPSP